MIAVMIEEEEAEEEEWRRTEENRMKRTRKRGQVEEKVKDEK